MGAWKMHERWHEPAPVLTSLEWGPLANGAGGLVLSFSPHPSPCPGARGIRRHGALSGMNVPGTDWGLFWAPLRCPDPLHIPACSQPERLPGPAFYSPPIHNPGPKVHPPSLPGGLPKEEKGWKCTEYSQVLLRDCPLPPQPCCLRSAALTPDPCWCW